jgi:hypothetical protein
MITRICGIIQNQIVPGILTMMDNVPYFLTALKPCFAVIFEVSAALWNLLIDVANFFNVK